MLVKYFTLEGGKQYHFVEIDFGSDIDIDTPEGIQQLRTAVSKEINLPTQDFKIMSCSD